MVELVDWAGKREAGLTAMHAFQQECRAAGSLPDDMEIEKGNAMIMEPCMYNYSQDRWRVSCIKEKADTDRCSCSILGPRCVDESIPTSIDTHRRGSAAASCAVPTCIHLTL